MLYYNYRRAYGVGRTIVTFKLIFFKVGILTIGKMSQRKSINAFLEIGISLHT